MRSPISDSRGLEREEERWNQTNGILYLPTGYE